MITRESALVHSTKYRQLQSDITKVISDIEDYLENNDDTIYVTGGPLRSLYFLYEAKNNLDDVVRDLLYEDEDELEGVLEDATN